MLMMMRLPEFLMMRRPEFLMMRRPEFLMMRRPCAALRVHVLTSPGIFINIARPDE